MSKKRKNLLFFVCLAIIGGVIFNITYISKKHENSVAIRINKEVATTKFVEIKSQVNSKKYKDFFLNDDSQKFLFIDPGYNSDCFGKSQNPLNIKKHPSKIKKHAI